MSDGTSAAGSIDPQNLARAIDQLEKNIDAINRTQKTARVVVLGGSLLLIAMLAIFGLSLFRTLKTQLNEETLQAALTAKAEALWPQLSDKLTATKMHHLTDAVAAVDVTLDDDEIAALEKPYVPRGPSF